MAIVALLDVVGQAILTVGLFFIGSGVKKKEHGRR